MLGVELVAARLLAGGDLSPVAALSLADGRRVIAKGGPAPQIEARMLRALGTAGARVPAVLAACEDCLVMEALPDQGALAASGWAELGTMLSALHDAPPSDPGFVRITPYGWVEDYAFGPVAIPNAPLSDWSSFWGERRLLPAQPFLPVDLARRIDGLAGQLPDRLPACPAPALLHGDLWAGNVLASGGRLSGLIDPASYYGDGEVDLAMLHLFGAPGPEFIAAYGALSPGWETRRAIYQLWPALVHVRLFGAGYHGMVAGLLDRLGV
ncbi:hypothetical protein TP2_07595 [Thioclava pacifica DSM 10166]|uniref:Aminoglycoside phosphotransferase domain-containing protein n=2 Tax=Thioclava pacifica TaxID=285109 RepID=A0A074JAD0_9RHOB|nr:hypothetical protein TP2_07595 [Thioclava pacifica DSM 10166]